MKVRLEISDLWELAGVLMGKVVTGNVVHRESDAWLVEIDEQFDYQGATYRFVVILPRHSGEELADCDASLDSVQMYRTTPERAASATPCDVSWWRGGHAMTGAVEAVTPLKAIRRLSFLTAFLGALGAFQVSFTEISESTISGTVIYSPADVAPGDTFDDWVEHERQDFRWLASEADIPSELACQLIALIRHNRLLDSDKLRCSRTALFERFESFFMYSVGHEPLDQAFRELLRVIASVTFPRRYSGRSLRSWRNLV